MSWEILPKQLNDHVGDALLVPKERSTTRIHFQNVNGIDVRKGGGWEQLCEHWKRMEVEIGMITEHKLDTTKELVQKKLVADATRVLGKRHLFEVNANSTPVEAAKWHKPGGVLSLISGKMKGSIIEQFQDPYGRWVSTTMQRRNRTPLTLITTYQVVKQNPKLAGTTTYAKQLYSLYYAEGREHPEKLRRHHMDDLVKYIAKLKASHHSILLAGDFNEDLADASGNGMSQLCGHQCELVDPIMTKFGITEFNTWKRGSSVIDYILVSRDLLPAIHRCGYEAYNSNIISDHRGLYLDVHTTVFFGDTPPQPKYSHRDFVSTKSYQIPLYFTPRYAHLTDHKWFNQLKTLRQAMDANTENHELAQKLYNRLVESAQFAANQLPRYRPAPYSPALIRLRNIKDLLATLLSHMTTAIDLSAEVADLQKKVGTLETPIPTNPDDCRKTSREATATFVKALREELQSRPLRKSHIDKCIQEAEEQGDHKKARTLRRMQQAETVNKVFVKLRAIRGKNNSGGLSHLLVPVDEEVDPKA